MSNVFDGVGVVGGAMDLPLSYVLHSLAWQLCCFIGHAGVESGEFRVVRARYVALLL